MDAQIHSSHLEGEPNKRAQIHFTEGFKLALTPFLPKW